MWCSSGRGSVSWACQSWRWAADSRPMDEVVAGESRQNAAQSCSMPAITIRAEKTSIATIERATALTRCDVSHSRQRSHTTEKLPPRPAKRTAGRAGLFATGGWSVRLVRRLDVAGSLDGVAGYATTSIGRGAWAANAVVSAGSHGLAGVTLSGSAAASISTTRSKAGVRCGSTGTVRSKREAAYWPSYRRAAPAIALRQPSSSPFCPVEIAVVIAAAS